MHGRALIAFFSASPSRRTEKVAHKLADVIGAELYEIVPAAAYSKDDLNWNDRKSRSSIEMNDPNSRPEIAGELPDLSAYDTIFVGFPIWWYVEGRPPLRDGRDTDGDQLVDRSARDLKAMQ